MSLAEAFQRWRRAPSRASLVEMSHAAQERMRADLLPPGPDEVEIEVQKMFEGETE